MKSPNFPSIETLAAPGFRFHPTEEELICYYLNRKIARLPHLDAIAEVDLYRHPPWELPARSRLKSRDREWFFFAVVGRKLSGSSVMAHRATPEGFWKSSGHDRRICTREGKHIGMRKCLVYYVGRCPNGQRTDWIMHEYRRAEDEEKKNKGSLSVVCRLFEKSAYGPQKADQYGAPLVEDELREDDDGAKELVQAEEENEADVLMDGSGERDHLPSDDFKQGATDTMHSIVKLIASCESSSSTSDPPSKEGLVAPGFRFHPTDEELVNYYLKRKVSGLPLHVDAIPEVNIYKWDPWDLPPISGLSLRIDNVEWYFFSIVDRKYAISSCSLNASRTTPKGYWKSSGNDRPIHCRASLKTVAMKKSLIFHKGRSPNGQRTNWVMHEYRLGDDEQIPAGSFLVVCKLYQKHDSGPRKRRSCGRAPFVNEECEETTAQDLVLTGEILSESDAIIEAAGEKNVVIEVAEEQIVFTEAAEEQNYMSASDEFEQGATEKMYSIGGQVEVAYIRENLPVAWYTATVIKVVEEGVLLVEYLSLTSDDGALLSEIVSTKYVRPRPPSTLEVRNFVLLDEIEAFHNGGWWPGVVAKVNTRSRYNVKFMHLEEEIEFKNTELRLLYDWVDGQWIQSSQDNSTESQNLGGLKSDDHMQLFHASCSTDKCKNDLITPSSVDGDEAPEFPDSSTNNVNANSEALRPCKKAKKGEMEEDNTRLFNSSRCSKTSSTKNLGFDVHSPIVEEEPNFYCTRSRSRKLAKSTEPKILGEQNSDNQIQLLHANNSAHTCKPKDFITSSFHGDGVPCKSPLSSTNNVSENSEGLRPCKRAKNGETGDDNTRLLSSSIFSDTSSAMKTGFDVCFPTIEEPNFHIKALVEKFYSTSPFKKADLASADSISKPSSNILLEEKNEEPLIPELDRQGDKVVKGATPHTAGENRRKNCRPQKLRIIEPSLEGDSIGNQRDNTFVEHPNEGIFAAQCSDNGSEAREVFNVQGDSLDATMVEPETSASTVQPVEAGIEAPNKLLSTLAKSALVEKVEDSFKPTEQLPLPFEKCSTMWKSIESMDIFNVLPQQPHFQPLEQFSKDFREGMAIGLMVTFSSLVNNIRKLGIADPRRKFDEITKTLLNLEAHGFDVKSSQARLVELLRVKDRKEHLVNEKSRLEIMVRKERGEKDRLHMALGSIEMASKGLEQSLEHLRKEKRLVLERKRENDTRLDKLEMDSRRVHDALRSAEREFEDTNPFMM